MCRRSSAGLGLGGGLGLDQVAARVLERNQDTLPASGRQELLENLLNSYL